MIKWLEFILAGVGLTWDDWLVRDICFVSSPESVAKNFAQTLIDPINVF